MKNIIINIKKFIYNDENGNLAITNIDNFEVDKLFINGKFIDFTGTITLDLLDITNDKKEFKISKEFMLKKDLFNLAKVFIDNKIYSINDIFIINIKSEHIINNEYLMTLEIESKLYYKEKHKNNDRKLKYPYLYKHFKGDIYCTKFISYPISKSKISDYLSTKEVLLAPAIHTETMNEITIYKVGNEYYHIDEYSGVEPLVIYTCVNNIKKYETYARPLNMFLSKVDKEKYPDIEQKYRFEEMGR